MNEFMKACEIAGPLQLAVRGPSPNESGVRLLHQPFALVGRDQRADVPLDHKLVSRRHVYLQIVEGQAFWLDLDSRSGTSAEGQLRKFGWLEAGKSIRIGPFGLQRLADSGSASGNRETRPGLHVSPLVARSYDDQALPEVSLEFLNGPSRSACWPMNRVMSLIGSASGCKFRLADSSVSPFHCSLLRTPLGLWIVDLLGPDGIGVNEALVRYALLADNDVLRVGRYRIRMRIRFASLDSDGSASEEGRRHDCRDSPYKSTSAHSCFVQRRLSRLAVPSRTLMADAGFRGPCATRLQWAGNRQRMHLPRRQRADPAGEGRNYGNAAGTADESVRSDATANVRSIPAGNLDDSSDVWHLAS